ncbi:hypothetical protein PUN28_018898 [Cardiocondyla obscurior]|uniref:Uncharacterized protein n=1 Tax=Cardiocondyla obscurior TaxID=286306 RepID=A0AAW2EID4_9HYME
MQRVFLHTRLPAIFQTAPTSAPASSTRDTRTHRFLDRAMQPPRRRLLLFPFFQFGLGGGKRACNTLLHPLLFPYHLRLPPFSPREPSPSPSYLHPLLRWPAEGKISIFICFFAGYVSLPPFPLLAPNPLAPSSTPRESALRLYLGNSLSRTEATTTTTTTTTTTPAATAKRARLSLAPSVRKRTRGGRRRHRLIHGNDEKRGAARPPQRVPRIRHEDDAAGSNGGLRGCYSMPLRATEEDVSAPFSASSSSSLSWRRRDPTRWRKASSGRVPHVLIEGQILTKRRQHRC